MPRALRAVSTDEKAQLQAQVKAEAPRPVDVFIDEKELLAKSTFPIKPDELIELAKKALDVDKGFLKDTSMVDIENFSFHGPVVGPLDFETVMKALERFDTETAFPVTFGCHHNFWVDPYEPSRVWYTTRTYAKNTGPVAGGPPTNKVVDGTPCMHSFTFNEQGKIVKVTIGYPMDRFVGNTGGLGGVFGMFYAVGKPLPFPEAQPYKQSWQLKVLNFVTSVTSVFKGQES